jgi:hypothetical protein
MLDIADASLAGGDEVKKAGRDPLPVVEDLVEAALSTMTCQVRPILSWTKRPKTPHSSFAIVVSGWATSRCARRATLAAPA